MRAEIIRAAAARLVVIGKTILQLKKGAVADAPGNSDLRGVLLIFNAQRQTAGEIILAVIGLGEKIAGEQIGVHAQNKRAAGEYRVNVPAIRNYGGRIVGE